MNPSGLERALIPVPAKGDVVVMDNLLAHKIASARGALEAAGMRLRCLPPHSADLNPIEMAFAKLKALPRKAAPRTLDRLRDKLAEILAQFSPTKAQITSYTRDMHNPNLKMLSQREPRPQGG